MVVVLISAVFVCLLMEPWSAWVHRAVWHGPLWFIHRTHHRDRIDGTPQGWVANDLLSAAHAPIAIGLIAGGYWWVDVLAGAVALGAGIGMTVYGALYVVFHDGMVHARLPVAGLANVKMFADMKEAHALHHKTNASPHGFFLSAWLLQRAKAAKTALAAKAARAP